MDPAPDASDRSVTTPQGAAGGTLALGGCEHIRAGEDAAPLGDACRDCQEDGASWVHLRVCVRCGYVGCCDESPNKHATQHFRDTQHPVIRSLEPGEDWRWCYAHRVSQSPLSTLSKDVMRRLVLFAGLSEEDLDRIHEMAETIFLPAGQLFIEEGSPGDAMYVVLDGEVEVTTRSEGREVVLARRGAREVIGEMSLLEDTPRSASVRTLRDTHLLRVGKDTFQTLLTCDPSTPLSLLRTVTSRLRSTEAQLTHSNKLAALGTLAAGLAHELNNPSSALQRGTEQLREALRDWESAMAELASTGGDAPITDVFGEIAATRIQERLSPLEQSDREAEVEDWLSERGLDDAWELAPALVAQGVGVPELEQLGDGLSPSQLSAVARSLAARSAVFSLLDEMAVGARAISELVGAVKAYSYMDRAPVQTVDVGESIETTLLILRHKLRKGVQVERRFEHGSQTLEAYAGDLNQVWTNIIDNAIHAMGGQGELRIQTALDGERIRVEICDTGPGMPAEVRQHIFDPFFTTKPQGEGSGLGMHIVYKIIVEKHNGQIDVESRPGRTCFTIRLPLKLARAE